MATYKRLKRQLSYFYARTTVTLENLTALKLMGNPKIGHIVTTERAGKSRGFKAVSFKHP